MLAALTGMRNEPLLFNSNSNCPVPFPCDPAVEAWTSGDLACVKAGVLTVVDFLTIVNTFQAFRPIFFSVESHTYRVGMMSALH
jgi:hypothetical protein